MKISKMKGAVGITVYTVIVNEAEKAEFQSVLDQHYGPPQKGHPKATAGAKKLARQLHDKGDSLRGISAKLAQRGYLGPKGKPYLSGSIAAMLDE
jgi:hypothetical protein